MFRCSVPPSGSIEITKKKRIAVFSFFCYHPASQPASQPEEEAIECVAFHAACVENFHSTTNRPSVKSAARQKKNLSLSLWKKRT